MTAAVTSYFTVSGWSARVTWHAELVESWGTSECGLVYNWAGDGIARSEGGEGGNGRTAASVLGTVQLLILRSICNEVDGAERLAIGSKTSREEGGDLYDSGRARQRRSEARGANISTDDKPWSWRQSLPVSVWVLLTRFISSCDRRLLAAFLNERIDLQLCCVVGF